MVELIYNGKVYGSVDSLLSDHHDGVKPEVRALLDKMFKGDSGIPHVELVRNRGYTDLSRLETAQCNQGMRKSEKSYDDLNKLCAYTKNW